MRNTCRGIFIAWLCAVASGCSPSSPKADDNRFDVLCSFFPMYVFTKNVVGDAQGVQVHLMAPAQGGCPHDYDLKPRDVERIASADVYVMNGAGLEAFGVDKVKQANPKIVIVDTSQGIDGLRHDHEEDGGGHGGEENKGHEEHTGHKDGHEAHDHEAEEHDHKHPGEKDDHATHDHDAEEHGHKHAGDVNPHFFSSPKEAARQVRNIAEALSKADPKNAETYRKNGEIYAAKLDALAGEFRSAANEFKHKEIVTMHEVFDYLARDCGLKVVGTVFSVAGKDPSPNEIAHAIKAIRTHKAVAVFTEPQYPLAVAKTIAGDAGVAVETLDPVASGPPDPPADFYERKMRENLATLKRVLGGG